MAAFLATRGPWSNGGLTRHGGGRHDVSHHAVRTSGSTESPRALHSPPPDVMRGLLDSFCAVGAHDTPRALFLVAHPDDESIGAGSRLFHLTNSWIAHITDGAPADPAVARRFGFATREEYAEQRKRELSDALRVAGVPDERVLSLKFMDGEVSLRMVEVCLEVLDLVDTIRPDVVITHPYEGGHTDHDGTAFAVHTACELLARDGANPPAVLELASYHASDGQRVFQRFLPDARADRDRRLLRLSAEDRCRKQQMFDCFSTQKSVIAAIDPGIEVFRPAPRYRFTRAPHGGALEYERHGRHDGRRWRSDASAAMAALRVESAA